jgi:arylsulfatase A-like enzyme/cytochrome c-type biogenesis protein CcmH/NrfG
MGRLWTRNHETTKPERTKKIVDRWRVVRGFAFSWFVLSWFAFSCFVFSCTAVRRGGSPPDILLITLDTTRADHIGAYGDSNARTPRIDRLASQGVLFERAISSAPITLPAHVSLFTGRYPYVHGVRNNGNFSLRDGSTLATWLHDRGYRTAAFVSAFVLDRRFGLAAGFDHYDDQMDAGVMAATPRGGNAPPSASSEPERRGDLTARAAVDWLNANGRDQRPWFVWIHLYDPHDPYQPPEPLRQAFADRPYDGEIAFADEAVGSVLDSIEKLGRGQTPLVALVGDHGESLGEHEEATHAMFVYEAALRVPMILAWPGHLPAGRRVGGIARGVDLAPTLLDLAAAAKPESIQGQSLMPTVSGHGAAPESAYAETYFPLFYMNWAPLRSLQDDRWKFIDAPEPELYDLSADAHERTNLAAREPARAAALKRALDAMTQGTTGAMSERQMDRETVQKLAALGYVAPSAPAIAADTQGARPDPKKMIGIFNRLREANAALQQGRPGDAEGIARDVHTRDPKNSFAAILLANVEMEQGRYRAAISSYKAYLELVPASADAHHRIAICYSRLGDIDRALVEDEAALAIDPRAADARMLRGGLLASRGRIDDALGELRAAVEINPANAPYRIGLARVLIAARRYDEAGTALARALELQPMNPAAHAASGALLAARGEADRAVAAFQKSLELDETQDDVRLDLARTLEQAGRGAAAEAEYRRLASGRETPPDIRRAATERLRR